ncbi:putative arginine N-methyltransferase [Aspergillus campestris IBT 28561]|uniref:Arginine N-methyltransferase 2 n=1 Tax=Aspergillus campestris (strain IBT 28561) TaxID=1392248 RepID=A0A2I1CUQ2_ASPC2|nr:putative arginine N-methyltransferase [Aspergillus campestris IBT 28561]PKY01334.1 putative arginine N-methyltransferase [Aspergillus campestris IBT 28561]
MTDPTTTIDVDLDIQEILLAASQHDIPKLRRLIRLTAGVANPANVKDPETGFSPLHAAISACEPDDDEDEAVNGASEQAEKEKKSAAESAAETVKFLLQEGAIWNDLDLNGETPGCVARRLGLTEAYEMVVDAGVRAELLLNRLDGYEEIEEEVEEDEQEEGVADTESAAPAQDEEAPQLVEADADVTQARYLDSNLTFQNDRLIDADRNGRREAAPTPGLRVLNVGHGMGIVDQFLQDRQPAEHHIIEAHADVVAEMKRRGWHQKPGVRIHEGRWQDVLPALVAEGEMFDAVYYDTFAESYGDFREFFTEQVIGLLEQEGRWSFFNGMGADRQISYDVYQKVVEMDLFEAGFDVEWEEIEVPKLEGEWSGVRRAYWMVDNYRLPLCKYMD